MGWMLGGFLIQLRNGRLLKDNVLIIIPRYIPYRTKAYYEFPLGLAYVSASLKRGGYDVDVINLNHCDDTQSSLICGKLNGGKKYHYVMSGGLSAHYKQLKEIVSDVRSGDKDAVVVLGGGIMSSTPELMYRYLKPDYMVLGEGEITVIELLSEIESGGKNLEFVKGIGYRDEKGDLIITRRRESVDNLDILPWPDLDAFEFDTYLKYQKANDNYYQYIHDEPRFYPIISSRGCPYNCTFCYHPLGRRYRSRSVEDFLKEVRFVVDKYGINNLAIFDELLSVDRNRLLEICEGLKPFSDRVRWMCQLRVDNIDKELLHTMRDAGCFLISYGFESANNEVLTSMKKHITKEQIEEALKLTREAGLCIQGYFIFGDTSETSETSRETLDFWKKYHDYHITLGYIRPYPGSELWEREVSKGHLDTDEKQLDFLNACINAPPNLSKMNSDEWFQLQKDVQKATMLNDHFSGEVSSEREEEEGTYTIKVECILCGERNVYKHFRQRILGISKIGCRKCNQQMNISPLIFQHVKEDYERNVKVFEKMKGGLVKVTVTPCMNEAEFVAMYEVALRGIDVVDFMDKDKLKCKERYWGKHVLHRNKAQVWVVDKVYNDYFLIPLTRFADRIFNELVEFGVDKNRICRLDEVIIGPPFIYDEVTYDN
jgi:anaerobic magnesium-protoporphyrin IX monomethyl ester cyclase